MAKKTSKRRSLKAFKECTATGKGAKKMATLRRECNQKKDPSKCKKLPKNNKKVLCAYLHPRSSPKKFVNKARAYHKKKGSKKAAKKRGSKKGKGSKKRKAPKKKTTKKAQGGAAKCGTLFPKAGWTGSSKSRAERADKLLENRMFKAIMTDKSTNGMQRQKDAKDALVTAMKKNRAFLSVCAAKVLLNTMINDAKDAPQADDGADDSPDEVSESSSSSSGSDSESSSSDGDGSGSSSSSSSDDDGTAPAGDLSTV
jgi:hypothetical protein